MLSIVASRQLKQIPDAASAKRLAAEMAAAKIDSLHVDVDQSPQKSLRFLEHFAFLKYLAVGGKAKDFEAIADLRDLQELCLLRATVPDFGFLAGLKKLRLFDMRFGGCKSFETLEAATGLIGVSLMRLPTLTRLDFMASLPKLQLLTLDSCKGVVGLPDFSRNPRLRMLVLETMNGLTSLEGVETATALERLAVMEAKALPPNEFRRVTRCPSLRKVLVGPAPTTSACYKEAVALVPVALQMDGYYGTENQEFYFDGYKQTNAVGRR